MIGHPDRYLQPFSRAFALIFGLEACVFLLVMVVELLSGQREIGDMTGVIVYAFILLVCAKLVLGARRRSVQWSYDPCPDKYAGLFTRTWPWASLGFFGRVGRVFRILVGVALCTVMLMTIGDLVRDSLARPLPAGREFDEVNGMITAILLLTAFVWVIGCVCILRPVYRERKPPPDDPPPPPDPPRDDAPKPAPLRPFSPQVLVEHADWPDPESAWVELAAVPPRTRAAD